MRRESYDDADLRRFLQATKTIAIVGASPDPDRHSHRVMRYMQHSGFRVLPVNPVAAGRQILGEPVYESLATAPGPFELVDVFRRADAIPALVDEVIDLRQRKGIRFLWLQLGLYDEDAAGRARAAGLDVIMDRCLKIEFGRVLSHNG